MFPCPEDVFTADKDTATVALTQTATDDDCKDDCPPFCACSCCGIQLMRNCNCIHIKTPVQLAVYHPVVQTLALSDVYRPIWQPPQLS
ncbi:hypothetical protein [Lacibacter cauensis]|uniref:hypothetical protein n=1 Tax=Lacibacter cauensis TaxID=510947 RepID=UPI00131523E9|nr:hypothetical protein [Lacibacter cauensis]